MIEYPIYNRFTGDIKFVAKIDCEKRQHTAVKRGFAVMWALENGADLTEADLEGAELICEDLTDAILVDADLSGADLSGAILTNADLRGADLSGADLIRTDLRGADLVDADFTYANTKDAKGL